ncbi:hypothetical protein HK405_001444, partial [Cladochytrium tenue]
MSEAPQPSYSDGVVVFSSQVAGSVKVRKDTTRICDIFSGHKIPHLLVDVSIDEEGKAFMREGSGRNTLPQIFVGGMPRAGGLEELEEANDAGELAAWLVGTWGQTA